METIVIHEPDAHRYEVFVGKEKVGDLSYRKTPGEIHMISTHVSPIHRGKNYAAILTRFALDEVRAEGTHKVVPVCSYTVRYMEKHPDTQDLLLNPIEEAIAFCELPKLI
jgi:predicted GNAT family acetyltransferase